MSTDTDETVCTEERVRGAVNTIADMLAERNKENWSHLDDEEYIKSRDHLSEEKARELYEEKIEPLDREDSVCAVLELYYSYRAESGARKDSLLAAATYAVLGRLSPWWNRHLSREDVADEFGVSVSVISDHNLDMLEHRFLHDDTERMQEYVERMVERHRGEGSTGLASVAE